MWHITEEGAKRCTAKPGNCPIDPSATHYPSKQDAEFAYCEKLAEDHNTFPPRKGEIDLPCAFGTMRVKDGDLSIVSNRIALVNGMCGSLALAVHDKSGGTPYFVSYAPEDGKTLEEFYNEEGPDVLLDYATHVLVESTEHEGIYLDAYGQKTLEDIKSFYGDDIVLAKGTRAMVESYSDASAVAVMDNFAQAVMDLDRQGISYSYSDFGEHE